jgi:V8-like Glu-specific endopeptidase
MSGRLARRLRTSLAAFALTAALLLSLPVSPNASTGVDFKVGPDASAAGVVGRDVLGDGTSARDVRRYWTPRRMRAAKPVDPGRSGSNGTSAVRRRAPGGSQPEGTPYYVPANPPGGGAEPTLQLGEVSSAQGVATDTELLASEDTKPLASEVPDTTAYPARTHGKVFFSRGSSGFSCSGTAINSAGSNVVFTAGHCVNDPDVWGWAENWLFVPGYRNGNAPFGEFAAEGLWALNGWVKDRDEWFDVGAAVVKPNGSGQSVEAAVGARGIAFNQRRDQLFTSWGYPVESPFTGQLLYTCRSRLVDDWGTGGPIGISCDMTGGSSGGGWVIADQYVNSVNAILVYDKPNVMFGPYFGAAAGGLYLTVCGCTRDVTPPDTAITSGPAGPTNDPSPIFGFTATEPGSFECRLDGGGWSPCSSPKTYSNLPDGPHSFAVVARDAAANIDQTPASSSFRVDTRILAPRVTARKKQRQTGRRIEVEVVFTRAQEEVTAHATGKVVAKGKGRKTYRLGPQVKQIVVFARTLRLKPTKRKHHRRIFKALGRGKKVRAPIRVKLTDQAGNSVREKRVVRLK